MRDSETLQSWWNIPWFSPKARVRGQADPTKTTLPQKPARE